MNYATYYEAVDIPQLMNQFPLGESFFERFRNMSRDTLRVHQERLFSRQIRRAWQIPFYQRLWGDVGITQADINGIEDIRKLPRFGKQEIMDSIDRHPPFGDHHGHEIPIDGKIFPMILHATSGTTGRPQPLLFGPRTREVHKLILARAYLMQGMLPSDVVHSVYGHGPVNGGHYIREAIIHYTNATFFPAGTGIETPSIKQVEFMRDFKATVIVGFADYIKRLADVAQEMGLQPGRDINIRMISGHLAKDARKQLSDAWGGVQLYDWYGVGDTGLIAAEGPDHDGMHVMEDAHFLEICDIDTGNVLPEGETGDLVITCLFSDEIFPIIRFNTHDLSRLLPGTSSLSLPFRRIDGFLGRSDSMIKLRGINVFPQALSSLLGGMPGFNGEYLCILRKDDNGREYLEIKIECTLSNSEELIRKYREFLHRKLGVDVSVDLVQVKSLSNLTGVEFRQKPIRLIRDK